MSEQSTSEKQIFNYNVDDTQSKSQSSKSNIYRGEGEYHPFDAPTRDLWCLIISSIIISFIIGYGSGFFKYHSNQTLLHPHYANNKNNNKKENKDEVEMLKNT